jgi:hypothetical protein
MGTLNMITKSEYQPQYNYLINYIENIQTIFSNDTEIIHKARNELKIISLNETKTVVKSFKIPHFINRIVYTFFRKSKAYKSYHNALRLTHLGISTPTPIAYIEFFSSTLLKNSYFLSLYIPYDFTIREALHHKIDDYESVLRQFTAFTYNLHQKGVWHLDYSPGNILICSTAKGYEFNIVDINRMHFKDITPIEGCQNFNKLWARDADIEIMGREYAKLSGLDEAITISEMKRHNDANKRVKNFKKRLKKVLKGDFSTPA